MKGEALEEAHSKEHEDIATEGKACDAEAAEADDDDPKNELDDAECDEASGIERNMLPSGESLR
jgi:hypothetical protein